MNCLVCLLVFLGSYAMVSANIVGLTEFKRVCYFTNWAQYRGSPMTFTADNIDPFLCTHIIYAFSQLDGNSITTVEWNDLSMYSKIVDMKTLNPSLKVMLAVGGYSHGVERFSAMASSDQNIDEFATSVINFLRKYRFDGLDLDWEFPAYGINSKDDKFRFTRLVQILRTRFDIDTMLTMQPTLLLSAAVSAGKWNIDDSYEVDIISQALDFINLMSYDFHGSWEGATGHHSPLYPRSDEQGDQQLLNQEAAVHYWISLGAPPHKIVMGLAMYGRTFTLANTGNVGLGALTTGPGIQGPYTEETGTLAYYEVCKNLENGWTRIWDNEHKVPYAFSGNQWVGYDDVESFITKAKFIRAMRLAGSMVWAVDFDDFNNVCGEGINPLMSALKNALEYQTVDPITEPPLPATTTTTTTPKPITSITTDKPPEIPEFKRVCYFTNWAQYRGSPMTFTADNIDPFLCTHIIYAFSQLDGNSMNTVEWNDLSIYKKVIGWKATNSALKVLLAVGGYNHGVQRFSDMVSSDQSIEEFAANTILFLRSYGFDGLDLDWEYPAYDTSGSNDKFRFTRLTQILRREFDLEGTSSNRPALLLSAAVAASKHISDAAYEIDIISQNLDFINLMSYDFHGTWDDTTGHNSPLYARQSETTFQKSLNQDAAVQNWISGGTPPHKLVMGLALYGRSFTLASENDVGLGAAVTGGGLPGQYTGETGYMGYYEICDRVENKGWTRVWDDEHQVPFAYSGKQWVGYDDVESFSVKAHYIKSHGLGGSMVWAMDLDDFNNLCGLGANPMMSVLKTILSLPVIGSTITPAPAPSSVRPTTGTMTRSSTTPRPRKTTTEAVVTTTIGSNMETTSNSPATCAPSLCPDSTIVPSACDAACVFQCCNGSHVEYCCTPGYLWNNIDKNCQKTVYTTTTPSPTVSTPINCDAPSSCTHGQFSPDPCDDQCYYNCGHGISYHQCCATGRVWDNYIKDCNYPELIQDDLDCRPKVCPPFEFLPEPCVPSCYYQCSSTGLDVRFCCHQGTIWDDSIKACNYPTAMNQAMDVFNSLHSSTTPAGKTLRSETNTLTHQINFMGCGIQVSFSPPQPTFQTKTKDDYLTTPLLIKEEERQHIHPTISTTKKHDPTKSLAKQTESTKPSTKENSPTMSPTKESYPTNSPTKPTVITRLPTKPTEITRLSEKPTDITKLPTKETYPTKLSTNPTDKTRLPTQPADITKLSTKPNDQTRLPTKPTDITRLPTKQSDITRLWTKETYPTKPSTKPTDITKLPTKEIYPTKPSTKPTDKTRLPTKPTDITRLSTKPTDITRLPTKRSDITRLWTKETYPTKPSTKPTDITKLPTKEVYPTKPSTKPTDKTRLPTKPTDITKLPTKPTDITRLSTKPTDITRLPPKQTAPTLSPINETYPTNSPTKQTDVTRLPTQPTDITRLSTKPTDITRLSTQPTDITRFPTQPTDVTRLPTQPTNITRSPTQPTDVTRLPTKPTDLTRLPTQPTDITRFPTQPTDITRFPTQPTDITRLSTKPTDKTRLPTKETYPTKPSTNPTDKTRLLTQPADITRLSTKPTDKTRLPTQPAEITRLSTKPTDKTKLPTQPAEITRLSTKPTDKTKLPTQPTEITRLSTKPTDITRLSTKPTDKTRLPTKPTDKTRLSTKPTDKTKLPTQPAEITRLSTKPTDKTKLPTQPTEITRLSTKPTDITRLSTKPTDKTRLPTQPTEITRLSTKPTDITSLPTKQTPPTLSPINETYPTISPTKQTDVTRLPTKQSYPTNSPTKQTQPTKSLDSPTKQTDSTKSPTQADSTPQGTLTSSNLISNSDISSLRTSSTTSPSDASESATTDDSAINVVEGCLPGSGLCVIENDNLGNNAGTRVKSVGLTCLVITLLAATFAWQELF